MYQFLTKRPHCLSCIVSSMRRRKKNKPGVNTLLPTYGRIELDSHADTVVLGSNCVVLHHTGRVCEVSPYMDEYDAITDVSVVRGATLWTDQHTNEEFILIFNEALWMGDTLTHSLINSNQLHAFGTLVQDNPYHTDTLGITPPRHTTLKFHSALLGPSSMPTPTPLCKQNYLPCLSLSSHHLLIGTHIMFGFPLMMWRRQGEQRSTQYKQGNNEMCTNTDATTSSQAYKALWLTQPHFLFD